MHPNTSLNSGLEEVPPTAWKPLALSALKSKEYAA